MLGEEAYYEGNLVASAGEGSDSEFGSAKPLEKSVLVAGNAHQAPASIFNRVLREESSHHRKIETMFRFYRICNTLSISNPDRIYNMFLTRLNTRKRLESLTANLELVVAALFYIDQRNSTGNNFTLRDVLARVPDHKTSLKAFSALVSKISRELGITSLGSTDERIIIGNMLDQLRNFCKLNIDQVRSKRLETASTTTVLLRMEEIDLASMARASSATSATFDEGTDQDENLNRRSTPEKTRYRLLYRLLTANYHRIENLSLLILSLVEGLTCSDNILDPAVRSAFSCRKTLFSSAIFIAALAHRIPATARLIYTAMNVHKSTFYRTHRNLLLKLSSALKARFNFEPIERKTILQLFSFLLKLSHNSQQGSELEFDSAIKIRPFETHLVDPTTIPGSQVAGNSPLTFNKALKCIDILSDPKDTESTGASEPEGGKASQVNKGNKDIRIYGDSKNYRCVYYTRGKARSKSFSVKYYGKEVAHRLATEYKMKLLNS